jgi:L-malate glycosyltransferase
VVTVRIGIICFPSVGGSGIVATELGKQLALRGHTVHVISSDQPFRLNQYWGNLYFHQVETPTYPLFAGQPPYVLTLANKIVETARLNGLDVIHAHYAVPHATAAFLAREILGPDGPRVVTTLHGTDITLMAADPSFADVITFSINRSDAVTAVSSALKRETCRNLPGVTGAIDVIPNFLECRTYYRKENPDLRAHLAKPGERIIVHMSNMRKVKRLDVLIESFARIAAAIRSRLLLIGDGPELAPALQMAEMLGVRDRIRFLGNQEDVVSLLSVGDLFLLTSDQESFGLAAMEAMACGVPVVATAVGGVPEVVLDGECGYLVPAGDSAAVAEQAIRILSDERRHSRFSAMATDRVRTGFCADRVVPIYENLYRRVLGRAQVELPTV